MAGHTRMANQHGVLRLMSGELRTRGISPMLIGWGWMEYHGDNE